MAYFISHQDSTKGKDLNINIINDIHNIKGKTSVNILKSNYANKHIKFNKGEYTGYLEPTIEEMPQTTKNQDAPTMHSITTERMIVEKVEPDTFKPPHHKLKHNIETKLTELLKEYNSQFAQDETSIGTTPLTEITIDTGTSELVSQKLFPIAMKHYQWVKDEINNLIMAKVIWRSRSSWSAPNIVVPKGDGGKHFIIDYHALNKVTQKFIWPMPKVEDIFSQLNGAKSSQCWDLQAGYHQMTLNELSTPKTTFTSPFVKYKYIKVPFGLAQAPAYFQELMTGVLKDFSFTITYLDDIIIFRRMAGEHLSHIQKFLKS